MEHETEKTFSPKFFGSVRISDPTRHINIITIPHDPKIKILSKKFNFLWLLNILYVLLCGIVAVLISYFGYKYGGDLTLIVSMYPAFQLGRIAILFIVEPEHKFWDIKYG